MAAARIVASGLAIPLPAMSGAEPWIGSYKPGPELPIEALGSIPRDPGSIEASSVRISPNMLLVTTTSNEVGRLSRCMAIESTKTTS